MHRNQAHIRPCTVKTAARCRRWTRHGQAALALVSSLKHVEERYDNPFEVTSLRGWRAFSGPDANLKHTVKLSVGTPQEPVMCEETFSADICTEQELRETVKRSNRLMKAESFLTLRCDTWITDYDYCICGLLEMCREDDDCTNLRQAQTQEAEPSQRFR